MVIKKPVYVLGHSDRELERLSAQARLVGPVTRQFFRDAGIGAGMRVLDVGSGAGDCAFLAGDLVGETGEVIGTDWASSAVDAATERANAKGLRNVSFRKGDPTETIFDRPFDAVVGRYVLLFQADPATMVRKLAGLLRPRGVVVFHEPTWDNVRSHPQAPTYDRCCRWIDETFRLAGSGTLHMASKLHTAFVGAGLPAPSMRMQTFISGPAGSMDFLQAMADLIASLLPTMEQQGVATAAEVQVATLSERLLQEVTSIGSVIIGRSEIGAWSCVEPKR